MRKKRLYFSFAGFVCQIYAPIVQSDYIEKCYRKSPFSSFLKTSLRKGQKVDSVLNINIISDEDDTDFFQLISKEGNDFQLDCSANLFFLFPVIEQVLRKIYYIMFFKNGGFVLHASGVTFDDKASVFIGESGAGKSTIMNILEKDEAFIPFADNNIFVIYDKKEKDFVIFKSPFLEWNVVYREEITNEDLKVSIKHIFVLKKSKKNEIRDLSFSQLVKSVVRQIQIPLRNLSEEEIDASRKTIFNFLKMYAGKIKELSFKNDQSVIRYMHKMYNNE